jgi:transposase InsO family protein
MPNLLIGQDHAMPIDLVPWEFCRTWELGDGELLLIAEDRTDRKVYRTRDAARADVFDYIERFYNPRRRHSKLGYLSPMAFEERAMQT